MTLHDFIFSNTTPQRLLRHLAFWIIFSTGFFLQSIVPSSNIFFIAFLSLCFFLPTCILAVYMSLYILLPVFLQQQLYAKFTAAFILMAFCCFILNYFTASLFVSIACSCPSSSIPFSQKLGFSSLNTTHAITITGLALAIKFTKNWYLRQKENLRLARQKITTELQLQKGKIYPGFLLQLMDKLHAKIASGTADSSALLLKLSDLLSYILYESHEEYVSLEKELLMLKNRLDIDVINHSGSRIIRLEISGDSRDKHIVPMSLFSLAEDFLKDTDIKDHKYRVFYVRIEIEQQKLSLRFEPGDAEIRNRTLINPKTSKSVWVYLRANTPTVQAAKNKIHENS